MHKYRFTIITVCYNAEAYIKNTIRSLLEQSYDNYEYIIKDGGSADRTMEIVHSIVSESDRIRIIANKDSGIYDAMNEAVDSARGEYVYFLNAGDCFCDKNVLARTNCFIGNKKYAAVYGNIIQVSDSSKHIRKYGNICSKRFYFLTGDCICHQALFARQELFARKRFDTRFKVCADKEWQIAHISEGKRFLPMKFEVAEVLVEGFSTGHISELEEETKYCINMYMKNAVWVYNIINYMKHKDGAVRILRAVGNICFVRRVN